MTRMHFTRAAEIVKAIKDGYWSDRLPEWPDISVSRLVETSTADDGNINPALVRACWTAEAFIIIFREYNSRFNQVKFLQACGLGEK